MILHLDLFTGYGGFSLGLQLAGLHVRTVAYVEWAKYPQEIIKARIKDGWLPDAPIFSDISSFRGEQFRGLGDVLVTAGFPCPPFSQAGRHLGASDPRNLWPETLRVIREVEPRWIILENVPGLLSSTGTSEMESTGSVLGDTTVGILGYAGTIVGQLAQIGYSVHWQTIGANDVGAPHRRKRWWCIGVADSDGNGLEGVRANSHSQRWQEPSRQAGLSSGTIPTWPPSPADSSGWEQVIRVRPDLTPALPKEAESHFRGVDDGRSHRVDELKALGNGIVPSVAAEFLRRISLK